MIRATIGHLQQCVVSADRRARWRCCPPAIFASNKRSDGNQELDCRRKMAFFAVQTAGNKAAMSASSDALEASIAAQRITKEGDVASSPSPLVDTSRSANRFLFAVGKVLPFASPLRIPSCNGRFQRRAGSINCCVLSFTRGRRCLVALSVWKQLKISKQVF